MAIMSDDGEGSDRHVKPFLDHLEDLRRTILWCLGAVLAGMIVCLPLTPWLLGILKAPLVKVVANPDQFLRSIEVAGAFGITMRLAAWCGLLISTPFLLMIIGRFVFPGLTAREQAVGTRSLGFAAILFVAGVVMGYTTTLPVALQVMFGMHGWLGIAAEWTVSSYVMFATQLLIGFGLAFELPVVVLVLGRLGLVNSRQLREKRRHVIVILLIVAMFLTPPDVFTQVLMAVPLIILYEFCIWTIWTWERRAG